MEDSTPNTTMIKEIPVEKLTPNNFNPNQMDKESFEQYVAEVRHLGRLPKPIIVRPAGNGFEIIDGEHGFRAAKELNFTTVRCEVQVVDDFEAMRQCFKRNRGGDDNPLRLGLMFQQMQARRKLSIRKLAQAMDMSDGTIRNHLDYVKALRLRNRCAGEDRSEEIAGLTHRQIAKYLNTIESLRDIWLDAGADLGALDLPEVKGLRCGIVSIMTSGLIYVLRPNREEFAGSLRYAARLCRWREPHKLLKAVDEFIRLVAERRLPVTLLDELPCRSSGRGTQVAIPPGEWKRIVAKAQSCSQCDSDLHSWVRTEVRSELRNRKIDPSECFGPELAEMQQIVEESPEFIRQAKVLGLEEKCALAAVDLDEPEDLIRESQRRTCEHFCKRRKRNRGSAKGREHDAARAGGSILEVFHQQLECVKQEHERAEENELFADSERLMEAVIERFGELEALRNVSVDGQPAIELLAERLDAMEWAEFYLIAACVINASSVKTAGERWLAAFNDSSQQEGSDE